MVSDVSISPDDSEGVVLAKVMKTAKEIRSGDKKRVKTGVKTPINRRPGWVPGGSVVCWRLLGCWRIVWTEVLDVWRLMLQAGGCWPFWAPERQGGRARRLGDGLPGMAFWVACLAASGGLPAGGWAAVIRRQFGGI